MRKSLRQLKELERMSGIKTMRLVAENWKEEWQTVCDTHARMND